MLGIDQNSRGLEAKTAAAMGERTLMTMVVLETTEMMVAAGDRIGRAPVGICGKMITIMIMIGFLGHETELGIDGSLNNMNGRMSIGRMTNGSLKNGCLEGDGDMMTRSLHSSLPKQRAKVLPLGK
jgi:hypothetical protein